MPIREDKVIYIQYQCAQCGAEDTGKYFRDPDMNDLIASPINCWSCKAGRGIQQDRMSAENIGMFAMAPQVAN
jgi:hypothetical protein